MFKKIIISLLLIVVSLMPELLVAQREAKDKNIGEKDFTTEDRGLKRVSPKRWYLKLSANVSYINMGKDVDRALGQVESLFDGGKIKLSLLNYTPEFTMKSDEKVSRAATNFLPTGNTGFGYRKGKHQFEFDFGIAGMVPLNTINVNSTMTMKEETSGDTPMADLEFVDAATGEGKYKLSVVINEEVWIFNPSIYYDYIFKEGTFGRFSAGASAGLMIISATQKVNFRFDRIDYANTAYAERIMQGDALSTAMHDVGPIVRVYGSYRKTFFGIKTDIRIGGHYGFVNMNRDVDGSGSMFMGGVGAPLPVSFPTSAMTVDDTEFLNQEKTRMEMIGLFIQIGIIF